MMTAIQKPSTVSSVTVTMVKKKVVPVADQNCAPRVPGGQSTVPPPGAGTLLDDPVDVVLEAGRAARGEETRGGVQAGILLEGHHNGGDDRVNDHD